MQPRASLRVRRLPGASAQYAYCARERGRKLAYCEVTFARGPVIVSVTVVGLDLFPPHAVVPFVAHFAADHARRMT